MQNITKIDSIQNNSNNLWKYLTLGLTVFVISGICVYIAMLYYFPATTSQPRDLLATSTAIGVGVSWAAIVTAVAILSLLITSIIIGYGFGLGFNAAGRPKAGRGLRSNE